MAETIQLLSAAGDADPLDLAVDADVIGELRVNGEQAVQAAQALRAVHGRAYNRGNVVNTINLAITHAPAASPAAAKLAAAAKISAIATKLMNVTLLDLVFGAVHLRLSNAAVRTYDIHARGTTVFASYVIVGGALSEV